MNDQNMEKMSGVTILLPPVINNKYKSTPKSAVQACSSCQLASLKKIIAVIVK